MRAVGLLVVLLAPACFTIPDYDGPLGPAASDEDADGVPNIDDLCPQLVNGAGPQIDEDNDGVGNACDPDPGVQNVHTFYSFDALDIGDLRPTGSVQPNDSSITIGVVGSATYNGVTSPRMLTRTQVDMRFFAMDGSDTPAGGFGLRVGKYGANEDDAGFCIVDVEGADQMRVTATYKVSSTQTLTDTSGVVDFPYSSTSGRIRATLAGTQLTCLVDQLARPSGEEHAPVSISLTLPMDAPAGTSGMFAIDAVMIVEYMFLVGVP